ncbi:hypothetical protein DETS111669_19410 [Delftia tsuruhatensis]
MTNRSVCSADSDSTHKFASELENTELFSKIVVSKAFERSIDIQTE